jgi:hypothetical protein
MTYFTALLPAHQGVAVYAALTRRAESLKSAGDPRTLNQIKADTLVESTTGTPGGITGVDISIVMTERTLLQADTEPARLTGYGVVPAAWARDLITQEKSDGREELKTWLRRLYTAPGTGDLVAMDSKRRLFPPPLRRFIQTRRHLPHTLLRRTHPPPRPHHPLARRRSNQPCERRRTLRSLQLHQRTPRLESPTHSRTAAHHRSHHTHGPQLPLHRTTVAGQQAADKRTARSQRSRNRAARSQPVKRRRK